MRFIFYRRVFKYFLGNINDFWFGYTRATSFLEPCDPRRVEYLRGIRAMLSPKRFERSNLGHKKKARNTTVQVLAERLLPKGLFLKCGIMFEEFWDNLLFTPNLFRPNLLEDTKISLLFLDVFVDCCRDQLCKSSCHKISQLVVLLIARQKLT